MVRKPSRRGFGTKMIASIFGADPGWSVKLDFDPDGLRCIMRFRLQDGDRGAEKLMAAAG